MMRIGIKSAILLATGLFASGIANAQHHDHGSAHDSKPGHSAMHAEGNEASASALVATLTPMSGLKVGEPVTLTLSLTTGEGMAVAESALQTEHMQKVHLLVVDPSLTDYHHEHPAAGATAGTYTFTVTPKMAGTYKVFADVVPTHGQQQFVPATFTVEGTPAQIQESVNSTVTVDGYRFDLTFDGAALSAGKPQLAKVTVTGPDGKPFDQLEPVMGAFAHVVGFGEGGTEVAHMHAMGKEPKSATDRGGPELNFHTEFATSGYKKLFVQVQIGGKQVFAPFGIEVPSDTVHALGNANCPVSDEPVGSMQAGASITYGGYEIGLCCNGCLRAFKKDPEKYLQKALAEAKAPAN